MFADVLPYRYVRTHPSKKTGFWEKKFSNDALWFDLGRDALFWGVKSLSLKAGDAVLMPASMCEVVLQPFLAHGIDIIYYDIDEKALFDYAEIETKVTDEVKALYITHYYGFPQTPDITREFCNKHNIYFIEDCAHALLGSYNGKPLGDFGDISIFSLRKFLPLCSGGVLKTNNPEIMLSQLEQKTSSAHFIQSIKYYIKGLSEGNVLLKGFNSKKYYPDWIDHIHDNYKFCPASLNGYLRNRLSLTSPNDVTSIRRANFEYYLSALKDLKLDYLYHSLPEGIIPYSFPILVDNQKELYQHMSANGILLEPTHNYTFRSIVEQSSDLLSFRGGR